jgi:hypothetical protein
LWGSRGSAALGFAAAAAAAAATSAAAEILMGVFLSTGIIVAIA